MGTIDGSGLKAIGRKTSTEVERVSAVTTAIGQLSPTTGTPGVDGPVDGKGVPEVATVGADGRAFSSKEQPRKMNTRGSKK